jgi:hypothetical protein
MPDEGLILSEVDPSWMDDGLGVIGEQTDPDWSTNTQWDTIATSEDQQEQDFTGGSGGSLTVTTEDGSGWTGNVTEVDGVTTLTFDSNMFRIYDLGGGQVGIGCAS